MKALSLFSGIGGLDLAAGIAGIETVALCEIEPYAVAILKKRYPSVPIYNDVRELDGSDFFGKIDVIHGGFPCQDLSVAGKQAGLAGERSGLWYEMLRIIGEVRPCYILAENVRGAVNLALDTVYSNLVNQGYKVYPYVIPASAVGAPHQRERLFVVGVREDIYRQYTEAMENPGCELRQGSEFSRADGVETGKKDADKFERPSGTLWPTHTQRDYKGTSAEEGLIRNDGKSRMDQLPNAVKFWPTPRQFMYKDSTTDRNKGNIGEKVGGQLNPDWVEQLMGFPEGWTDLEVDEPSEWVGWPAPLGDVTPTPNARDWKDTLNSKPNQQEHIVDALRKSETRQYPYEFPRTTTGCKDRAKRLKALGNAVVPAQAYPFFRAITLIEEKVKIAKEE